MAIDEQSSEITRIVIVGGGSAGWITAATIASEYQLQAGGDVSVTLIESPDIPTIGVGEGTWPSMRSTIQRIGLSETDFIRQCDASFKQGSKFVGWTQGQKDTYYHPFSLPSGWGEQDLAVPWQPYRDKVSFGHATSMQPHVCDQGLAPKQISTPEYSFIQNYGYHLDAGKFSHVLMTHATEKLGVQHILDNVEHVKQWPNGDVKSVSTVNHGDIEGDLFVDCTGFAALLIDKTFNIPFNNKAHYLFNDRAFAVQVPYVNESDPIASATISTAHEAGWIWDIGLPSRRGTGYVFSSAHISEDQAEQTIRAYAAASVGDKKAEELPLKKIKIVPGYREKFWHKNCVAVGLSAGFIEPLEASALVLIETAAKFITEQLPSSREAMDVVAKSYNETFSYHWERIIDFLKLHYILTQRKDSDYWIENCKEESIPASLSERMALWRDHSPSVYDASHARELFSAASYQFVLYGMGFETKAKPRRNEKKAQQMAEQLFADNAKKTNQLLNALPTNRDLIKKIHEFGLQKI